MKKIILSILLVWGVVTCGNAQSSQYCGNSGPSVCIPGNLALAGFSPSYDSLPVMGDNIDTDKLLEFKNFDSVTLNGRRVAIHSLEFDTIGNLPNGYCWATSDTNNTFSAGENACILLRGTPGAYQIPGQYRLNLVFDIDTGITVMVNAAELGLSYYLRVNCCSSDSSVRFVDTMGESAVTNLFLYYTCQDEPCVGGIKEEDNLIQSLTITPNPLSNQSIVSFTSTIAGQMNEKITAVIGSLVYSKSISVKSGQNVFPIARNGLASGVYFYSISDGLSISTKRLVVMD